MSIYSHWEASFDHLLSILSLGALVNWVSLALNQVFISWILDFEANTLIESEWNLIFMLELIAHS